MRMLADASLFFTLQCILAIKTGFVDYCEWLQTDDLDLGVILIILNVVLLGFAVAMDVFSRAAGLYRETQLVGIFYKPGDYVASEGSACKVYRGEFKASTTAEPKECVVKIRELNPKVLKVEDGIMTYCRHPNVVNLFLTYDDGHTHYLAMMPCECSLRAAVSDGRVTDQSAVCTGITNGVQGLHDAGFVHCNVNPDNVLLSYDEIPVLCGFSCATILNMDA